MDFKILIDMAKNTGRQTFILNRDLGEEWTNSPVSFAEILGLIRKDRLFNLLNSDSILDIDSIKNEVYLPCNDGKVVKLTPLIENERIEKLLVELFTPDEINVVFSNSSFGKKTSYMSGNMVQDLFDLIGGENQSENSFLTCLLGKSANYHVLTKLYSGELEVCKVNVHSILSELCDRFKEVDPQKILLDRFIKQDVFMVTDPIMYKFAVANLMINAYEYSKPYKGKKTISVSSYLEGNDVATVVCNRIEPFDIDETKENIVIHDTPDQNAQSDKNEGIGLAICNLFCIQSNGELKISHKFPNIFEAKMLLPEYEHLANKSNIKMKSRSETAVEKFILKMIFDKI